MTAPKLPVFFISHGGGPWPWMHEQMGTTYDKLAESLASMPAQFGSVPPKAVLMISAHWEAPAFTVMANEHPPMLYDYGGFPEHTYRVKYPAPGSPIWAHRVRDRIEAAGLATALDEQRGFDHGCFSPMAVIYPDANVPVIQLSLKRGLDPAEHLALGRALAPLREEGVAIIASGLSYHNLRAFGAAGREASAAFDQWLQRSLIGTDPAARDAALIDWESAPAARQAHPREEHLLPLMVAAGAAGDDAASLSYHEDAFMGSLTVSSYRFG